jgi:hypothetical protein
LGPGRTLEAINVRELWSTPRGTDGVPDFLTLCIKQKVRHGKVEQRLKTANGFRQVDLHPTIARAFPEES